MTNVVENVKTLAAVLVLPIVCTWRFALSPFVAPEKEKTWRRVLFDSIFRWVIYSQNLPQIAYLMGSTENVYKSWAKRNSLPVGVEVVEGDGKLLWIGSKRTDRIVLYLHGGGFVLPLSEDAASFWEYVRKQLRGKGLEVGVVMLDYTLVPHAHFPVPLLQTVAAVNHLLSAGAKPENIILTGDSAGANLVIQLLLHIIHPLDGFPRLPTGIKFGGAFLLSPWTKIFPRRPTRSWVENNPWDIVDNTKLLDFGARVSSGISDDSYLPYLDDHLAPDGWYNGIEKTVESVLITAGGGECLRDDILEFGDKFCKTHPNAKVLVDKHGVHDEQFLDFFAGESKVGELTPVIVQWCKENFTR